MAVAGLIFSLLQSERYLLIYRSTYNVLFMELPASSFVSCSLLLTAKSIDLVVACDGFLCIMEIACISIEATLIVQSCFSNSS